jgi:hypothetical protein
VETAAFALARSPGEGRRALLARLEEEPDPARLDLLLQALEAASRRGEEGLVEALVKRFDGGGGRARLVAAIALCRVLRTGPYMGQCRQGPLERGEPVDTWRRRDQVDGRLGTLTRVLQSSLLDPADPLGGEAARSLGRLLGLWQVFSLNRILTVAAGRVPPARLALLLREAANLSPMTRTTLRFHLGRDAPSSPFRRIPLGLEPPRGGALDLAALDPLTWALAFDPAAGSRSPPGRAGE